MSSIYTTTTTAPVALAKNNNTMPVGPAIGNSLQYYDPFRSGLDGLGNSIKSLLGLGNQSLDVDNRNKPADVNLNLFNVSSSQDSWNSSAKSSSLYLKDSFGHIPIAKLNLFNTSSQDFWNSSAKISSLYLKKDAFGHIPIANLDTVENCSLKREFEKAGQPLEYFIKPHNAYPLLFGQDIALSYPIKEKPFEQKPEIVVNERLEEDVANDRVEEEEDAKLAVKKEAPKLPKKPARVPKKPARKNICPIGWKYTLHMTKLPDVKNLCKRLSSIIQRALYEKVQVRLENDIDTNRYAFKYGKATFDNFEDAIKAHRAVKHVFPNSICWIPKSDKSRFYG